MPIRKLSIDEAMKMGVSSKGEKKSSVPWIPRQQASGPGGRQLDFGKRRRQSPTISEEEAEAEVKQKKAPRNPTRRRRSIAGSGRTFSATPSTMTRSPTFDSEYASSVSVSPAENSSSVKSSPSKTREVGVVNFRAPQLGPTGRGADRSTSTTPITSTASSVPTSSSTSAYTFTGGGVWTIPVFKFSPKASTKRQSNVVLPSRAGPALASRERLQEALIGSDEAHKVYDSITTRLDTTERPASHSQTFQRPQLRASYTSVSQTRTSTSTKTRPEARPHLSLDTTKIKSSP